MMNWSRKKSANVLQSKLVQNSAWGMVSNMLQILFVSLFFAIIARKYPSSDFAKFLISTTVYQLIAAFSSMGLGQWFIRQYVLENDKLGFTSKFFKTQLGLGLLFYVVNIGFAYLMYPDAQIRALCVILGTNIIFDNCINAIRTLNIAEGEQRKTAIIMAIDGFLKLIIGCLLFIHPFTAVVLAALMIVVRVLTLGVFIKLGSANSINLKSLWNASISIYDLKVLIVKNWQFIVIGSISIIYWKIGNVIISKTLTLTSVADYEIAFRIFSVFQILPVVASATIYPQFIKYYNERNYTALKQLYKTIFLIYTFIALASYVFIFSFSGLIIPVVFGRGYPGAVLCLKQMFLTYLLLPTVLLQANLIVAIGLEKLDMWFNIASLIISVAGCFIGLYFVKDLSVINYSVVLSFVSFHILQDVVLIRKRLITAGHCYIFYAILVATVVACLHLTKMINPYLFFVYYLAVLIIVTALLFLLQKKRTFPFSFVKTAISEK